MQVWRWGARWFRVQKSDCMVQDAVKERPLSRLPQNETDIQNTVFHQVRSWVGGTDRQGSLPHISKTSLFQDRWHPVEQRDCPLEKSFSCVQQLRKAGWLCTRYELYRWIAADPLLRDDGILALCHSDWGLWRQGCLPAETARTLQTQSNHWKTHIASFARDRRALYKKQYKSGNVRCWVGFWSFLKRCPDRSYGRLLRLVFQAWLDLLLPACPVSIEKSRGWNLARRWLLQHPSLRQRSIFFGRRRTTKQPFNYRHFLRLVEEIRNSNCATRPASFENRKQCELLERPD